jgi:phosphatidylglycerophosphatase A
VVQIFFSPNNAAVPPSRPSLPVRIIATSLGSGYSPVAPGTCGTLTAIPMAWGLAKLGTIAFGVGFLVITAIGTWAAEHFCRATGMDDDQRIVVDEVAGYLLTLMAVAKTPVNLVLAFFLFRLFDIWKPPPVRWVDNNLHGGIGVMADDLAAGVYAGLVLFALNHFGAVAWIERLFK